VSSRTSSGRWCRFSPSRIVREPPDVVVASTPASPRRAAICKYRLAGTLPADLSMEQTRVVGPAPGPELGHLVRTSCSVEDGRVHDRTAASGSIELLTCASAQEGVLLTGAGAGRPVSLGSIFSAQVHWLRMENSQVSAL